MSLLISPIIWPYTCNIMALLYDMGLYTPSIGQNAHLAQIRKKPIMARTIYDTMNQLVSVSSILVRFQMNYVTVIPKGAFSLK